MVKLTIGFQDDLLVSNHINWDDGFYLTNLRIFLGMSTNHQLMMAPDVLIPGLDVRALSFAFRRGVGLHVSRQPIKGVKSVKSAQMKAIDVL